MNKTTESVRKDLEGGDVGEDITGSDGNVASEILKKLDANSYATKKTIAQGLLDVALLTANASQLKYILQVGEQHEFYHLMLGLIITSIILQLMVAILFVTIGGLNLNATSDHKAAIILNDVILIFIFIISLVNIIISGFGIEYSNNPLKLINQQDQQIQVHLKK
ncbi:ninjurin-2 isoform X2 [Onthophagus taurus]|uniref:ninjurin-2 isoform X2 n=1 Tax=Onthophagus taurus TaxID=166361 RepID=UPI0039BEC39D